MCQELSISEGHETKKQFWGSLDREYSPGVYHMECTRRESEHSQVTTKDTQSTVGI